MLSNYQESEPDCKMFEKPLLGGGFNQNDPNSSLPVSSAANGESYTRFKFNALLRRKMDENFCWHHCPLLHTIGGYVSP